MAEKKVTYASAMAELEKIVSDIDSGEVDVDVLAAKVKRARELITFCSSRLRGAQDSVNEILHDMQKGAEAGSPGMEPEDEE